MEVCYEIFWKDFIRRFQPWHGVRHFTGAYAAHQA